MKKVSRQQINEVINLIKEAEKLTGKKITFKKKHLNEEIEDKIYNIKLFVKNIKKIMYRHEYDFLEHESKNAFNIIMANLTDIEKCCEVGHQGSNLSEDVDMDIDQITNEPDVVKKLNDKKININLVDKNNRNSSSSSSTTTSSTTY